MSATEVQTSVHILIVSGHAPARRQLEEGLNASGYEAFSAADGESALAVIKKRRVDVVITTSELLGMNGIQLSRAVTRIHPHVPVIVMSARPDPSEVAQALSAGAADVASEMTSPEEMCSVIEQCIERKAAATHRIISDRPEVLLKAIRAVTAAIDAKSHHAARHSGRVREISLLIGSRLDLSTQETMTLELAAQLHDIGKIGTPESVLTKPGILTDEEWVDVLKHPTLGSVFLAGTPELEEIAGIVRHHHEHFDGTGYPDGLQGEAIPVFSRIIAVADAYDAMTSERPYRRAMSHEQAVEELDRHSGTQFDASIVHCLLEALGEVAEQRKAA